MSSSSLTLAQSTLRHRLEDIPASVAPHIKMGFTLLARLDDARLNDITSFVITNFARRSAYDMDKAVSISGIDRNVVGDLLSSVALVVGAVFDLDVATEDFFALAPDGLLSEESRPYVLAIIEGTFRERGRLTQEVDSAKIANAVIASFRRIDCAVDVRLKFDDEDNVVGRAPVAVIYIDTDGSQEIWFQAAGPDLDTLIEKLTDCRRWIDKAKGSGDGL